MARRRRFSPISISFRLAMVQGLLVLAAVTIGAIIFYLGTVGVLARGIETKYTKISDRLVVAYATGGRAAAAHGIEHLLEDGVDSDTEVYMLVDSDGRVLAGNASELPLTGTPLNRFSDQKILRAGRNSTSRLLPRQLSNGDILVVGHDMADLHRITLLVWRALGGAVAVSLVIAVAGALGFRRQVDGRLFAIRATARSVVTGDLSSRIPSSLRDDEFSRLNRDINRMLDQIQQLMEGTVHVSNTIAHNLRSPLGRIRSRLDQALRTGTDPRDFAASATAAIAAIDELIGVFEKLLTIAEAEAGVHRRSFGAVALAPLIDEVVEFYDATAEERGIALRTNIEGDPTTIGDKDLLAVAVSNLVDNALKYAGAGATVEVGAAERGASIALSVSDTGPGIPASERPKVTQRFYRLEATRSKPGTGLGLSMVAAIASLHLGKLVLSDAAPGLTVRIDLPKQPAAATAKRPSDSVAAS